MFTKILYGQWYLFAASPPFPDFARKKAGADLISDSATRLSTGDPLGFPPHFRKWFSIIVQKVEITFFLAVNYRYVKVTTPWNALFLDVYCCQ
jgi:hypothetical protein